MSYGLLTPEQAEIIRKRYLLETSTGDDLKTVSKMVGVGCLHEACPNCGGTGVRKDGTGMCIHGISCPCPKCSFTC